MKEQKQFVSNLVLNLQNQNDIADSVTIPKMNMEEQKTEQTPYEILLEKCSALQKDNEKLQFQIENYKLHNESLQENNKKLQLTIINSEKKVEITVREVLANFLSLNQVDIELKNKIKVE